MHLIPTPLVNILRFPGMLSYICRLILFFTVIHSAIINTTTHLIHARIRQNNIFGSKTLTISVLDKYRTGTANRFRCLIQYPVYSVNDLLLSRRNCYKNIFVSYENLTDSLAVTHTVRPDVPNDTAAALLRRCHRSGND